MKEESKSTIAVGRVTTDLNQAISNTATGLQVSSMTSVGTKSYKLPKLVDEVNFNQHEDNPLPANEQAFLKWEDVNYFVPAKKPDSIG
jgi:hypothetical protein